MNYGKWIFTSLISMCFFILSWNLTPQVSSKVTQPQEQKITTERSELIFYDLRLDSSEKAISIRNGYKAERLSSKQNNLLSSVYVSMKTATDQLKKDVPGLKIERNLTTSATEIVEVTPGCNCSLAQALHETGETDETIATKFLSNYAALYGLTSEQMALLKIKAKHTNSNNGLSFVEFEQKINNIPVFQGTILAALTKDKKLFRTVGNLAQALDYQSLSIENKLSPQDAVSAAAKHINITVNPSELKLESSSSHATAHVVSNGPFTRDTETQMMYFAIEPGVATLAYSMVLWGDNYAYYILVDANDGNLLFLKNIKNEQTEQATYSVYNNDSPAPLSPSNATPGSGIQGTPISRTTFNLISELPTFNNLGWIPDGSNTTTGNNVDAGLDIDGTNGIDANGRAVGSPYRVFNFNYTPGGVAGEEEPTGNNYRMGVVTNMFFWANRYHDKLYQLGFTEAAKNFQNDNFGRGGSGNDAVMAEAQDSSGRNNANFYTPPDGSKPRMQMFIFDGPNPDRDSALDQEVLIHELTHGLSNRLHGNASGLYFTQARGLGEGWSDFYARALLSTADEDVDGIYPAGGYLTKNLGAIGTDNYYYGIRRFPYAVKTTVGPNGKPHNPLTFADIDPTKINLTDGAYPPNPISVYSYPAGEHNIGEVWCMALLEVRARLIKRLGFDAGNQRALQLVTDAMKLDPINPTLLQARDSILVADCAAFNGEDELDIWAGFATRGMGYSAKTGTGYSTEVTEAFDVPNLPLGAVTFSDTNGNNNGAADPGETILLTIPLINPLCKTDALNTSVTIENETVTYGTITHGSTTTKTIKYTVPASTTCGSKVNVPIVVKSSLGEITRDYPITTGQVMNRYSQDFDSTTPPQLPAGWLTSTTGDAAAWITSATNSSSSPNNIHVPRVSTFGNYGNSELVSPRIYIDSSNAKLSFKNLYNIGSYSDSLSLQISINGASFTNILDAGASFVTGGYTEHRSWSGLSGGTLLEPAYVDTVVNLPASLNGKYIKLKWHFSNNSSYTIEGDTGIRLDNIVILGGAQCSPVNGSAPVVAITSPANHTTFAPNQNITIEATATDADGSVSKVEFFQENTKLGEDTTAPYSFTWSNVPRGSYIITAKAIDNSNNVTASNGSFINVVPACSFSINQTTVPVDGGRTFNSVNLTTDSECNWTAYSNSSWITITSGKNGYGNKTINYTVEVNDTSSPRTGTLTIGGKTLTVNQAVCSFSLSQSSVTVGGSQNKGSVTINTTSTCPWTITNTVSWISVYSSSGTGSGTVSYTVTPNYTGSSRTGTLTIAGQTFTVTQNAINGLQYYPLPAPVRLLDTRPGEPACSMPSSPITGQVPYTQLARGSCAGSLIPANAVAIVGNATVVNDLPGANGGYLTIYPNGVSRPTVSNLNFAPGQIVPNSFTVNLGSDGTFNIYSPTTTHVLIDVTGYYAPPSTTGLEFYPLPRPFRLLDTRPGEPACVTPKAPLTANTPYKQSVFTYCSGTYPIPYNAAALVGNATVVNDTPNATAGYITLYPSGSSRPTVSNLNYTPGQVVPNSFTVKLGSDSAMNIYSSSTTNIVIDIVGYYAPTPYFEASGYYYQSLSIPVRLLDTRPSEPACLNIGRPLFTNNSFFLSAHRTCNGITIPSTSKVLVGNATVVNDVPSSGAGYSTLYPNDGFVRPVVSNLNYAPGQVVANSFMVGLGDNGGFGVYTSSTTNFVVDVSGYFAKE
jgi:hypothetical protein